MLEGSETPGQVAKAYGAHPNSVGLWKRRFAGRAPENFADETTVNEYERRIRYLEQLLGRKEVEIALLRISWAEVAEREGEGGARLGSGGAHDLAAALQAAGLARSTW